MSKAFPTKNERAKMYFPWATGLTIVGIMLWSVTYVHGIMWIYGFICPLILGAAVWTCRQTLRNRNSIGVWLLLAGSGIFFIISLLPWVLPIAR